MVRITRWQKDLPSTHSCPAPCWLPDPVQSGSMERVYPVIRKPACLCLPFFHHIVVDHYLSGLARSEQVAYWHPQVIAPIGSKQDCFASAPAISKTGSTPASRHPHRVGRKLRAQNPWIPTMAFWCTNAAAASVPGRSAGIDECTTASASMIMPHCRLSTARPLGPKWPSAHRSRESSVAVENCRFEQNHRSVKKQANFAAG